MSANEVIVVGGGVVGAATALALADRGEAVTLIEREGALAAMGSSKGGARIFAPAAYPDESYLEMGLRALERWRAIEADSGRDLLIETGALTVGGFAERALASLQAAGERVELVSADEAQRRFGVDTDGRPAVHQPAAGVIRADQAHAALIELADSRGVSVRRGEVVRAIDPGSDGADVVTDSGGHSCGTVVVAAGPWSAPLLATAGIELRAKVTAQTVVQLRLRADAPRPVALMDFDGDEPYGLWDPAGTLKVAFHSRGDERGLSAPPRVASGALADLEAWAARTYPAMTAERVDADACFYTWTPREEFVIERHGPVVVAAACNGQGCQFAPETGDRVARVAVGAAEVSSS
jgi:sarcosine oxidase